MPAESPSINACPPADSPEPKGLAAQLRHAEERATLLGQPDGADDEGAAPILIGAGLRGILGHGLADIDCSLAQKRRWLARIACEMRRELSAVDTGRSDQPAVPSGRPMLATTDQGQGCVRSAMSASGLGDDPATADELIRYIGCPSWKCWCCIPRVSTGQ